MMRILEAQAPARQTATDTIQTLSSRLSSATLLEDRRAAIQGLRSFAKLFPASVASGALRDLIAGLRRDAEDPDTLKVVLETLLMLFEPDETSPEASEEITLWLADEFTQRQDNITALLDLLELAEFYPRLYALQILSHVSTARPQRTQETVFAAPLGVSRITNVLDDKREAVRNEALVLLVALTPTSAELQKVVAFENAFDRVFVLIEGDGGLTHGSTTVQDCLSLLANLLSLNTSNQSYFREIGGILKLKKLLSAVLEQEDSKEGVSEWMKPQRDMNVWGLLGVIQLFLARGAQGTLVNQQTFWQTGALQTILHIAFHSAFSVNVRAKSLQTCGDLIRGNHGLQERFGDLPVRIKLPDSPTTNGNSSPATKEKHTKQAPTKPTYHEQNVIESLLELALEPAPIALFDIRLAALSCVKSFVEGHAGIRAHVLHRAIEGHRSGDDAIPNMLTVLLEPPSTRSNADPYQQWMAAVLLLHLVYENAETKEMALKVTEGDAESGEEVVTFIQSITSNIIAGVRHVEDERALIGFLMLLLIWLFEDPEAVNDLLGEGSNVQGLITTVKLAKSTMPLVAGLAAFLLGLVYEFSTKDSPVPRSTLHGLLIGNMGRETYVDSLTRLRETPFVRDFEVLPQAGNGVLPDVFFDKTFIDFLKDNFSRFLRAIDRDPKFEVSIVSNGVQKGVSRDLVDSLRAQVEEQKQSLESVNTELLQLKRRLEQEELDHRRTRESSTVELSRIKQINQSLHENHEDEIAKLQSEIAQNRDSLLKSHEDELHRRRNESITALDNAKKQHDAEIKQLELRLRLVEQEAAQERAALLRKHEQELAAAKIELQNALDQTKGEVEGLRRSNSDLRVQLETTKNEHSRELAATRSDHEKRLKVMATDTDRAERHVQDMEARLEKALAELEQEKAGRKDVQTELDDLLIVFGDLQAQRSADKKRLKELGEEVSDDEDEGEEDEEDDVDEDEEKESGVDEQDVD